MKSNSIVIIGATATVIFGVLFCLLLWWLVFKAVRVLVKDKNAFGTTVPIRLIALGITVLMRPEAVFGLINAFTAFAKPFLEKVPALASGFAAYYSSGDISNVANFGTQLAGVFVSALTNFLSELELPGLILALAIWVALGSILSVLLQNQLGPSVAGLYARVASLSYTTRTNIALFAILGFACYLSIGAIVAVPCLRQSAEATEPEVAALTARLDASTIAPDVYASRYPLKIEEPEGFYLLRTRVRELTRATGAPQVSKLSSSGGAVQNGAASDGELSILAGLLDMLDSNRSKMVDDYRILRDKGVQQQTTLKNTALGIFTVNEGRGKQERARYATQLDIWYRAQISSIEAGVPSCLQPIGTSDSTLNLLSGALASALSLKDVPILKPLMETLKQVSTSSAGCSFQIVDTPPELRPASRWGPLGAISRWILGAESLDLALITGMLGFGLFGAAISKFVRHRAFAHPHNQALVTDLTGVIIRGVSAAIVVFLAALGGLAIFSQSQTGQASEPNPYALFLTCLAAAVFSEDVWLRVQRKLREQTGVSETAGASAQPSGQSADSRKQDEDKQAG